METTRREHANNTPSPAELDGLQTADTSHHWGQQHTEAQVSEQPEPPQTDSADWTADLIHIPSSCPGGGSGPSSALWGFDDDVMTSPSFLLDDLTNVTDCQTYRNVWRRSTT